MYTHVNQGDKHDQTYDLVYCNHRENFPHNLCSSLLMFLDGASCHIPIFKWQRYMRRFHRIHNGLDFVGLSEAWWGEQLGNEDGCILDNIEQQKDQECLSNRGACVDVVVRVTSTEIIPSVDGCPGNGCFVEKIQKIPISWIQFSGLAHGKLDLLSLPMVQYVKESKAWDE